MPYFNRHSLGSSLVVNMPKVSTYTRTRIEFLHKQGLHPAGIFKSLKSEGLSVSFSSVSRIIKKLRITGSVTNLPRSGRPQKLSIEAKAFIDQQMRSNDEMTSAQIKKKLAKLLQQHSNNLFSFSPPFSQLSSLRRSSPQSPKKCKDYWMTPTHTHTH